ncbi:MAG: pseudouridine-5'-phosphate glycosidase [Hydrogenibacillus sp.]|nr:pseudouridine-5'-phosphate glycosidase [Hydrogenibacillus sp.]
MSLLAIHPEVAEALARGFPVVALESTIISHGMPYPDNVRTALDVERVIRAAGAVPATIALLDGKIRIGLSEDDIERLGSSGSGGTGSGAVKASVKDIPRVLAAKEIGATTVAATAHAASLAGIRFFATGGIGGVHRGAEETFDISADLVALSRTKICIVSAGVKSILDIGKTLELFETLGIPVYGFETDRYPGFYVRDSGYSVEAIDLPTLVALLKIQDELDLRHAVHVAVPIPEAEALDPAFVEETIRQALREAERQGIAGKAVTPFLLSRLVEQSGGKTLQANIALIKHNAETTAKIAAAYQNAKNR